MMGLGVVCGALAGAALFASTVTAVDASSIDPIVIKGKHFFYSTNGSEFFIRGVAYQQDYTATASDSSSADSYTDPLADITTCNRDIPYLVQLSTNVIRTYAVDPTKDHSACMNALAAAGIYVISDLSAPDTSINRDDPAWTTTLYSRYTSLIDNLSQYQNVIGFFAGNEVSNSFNTTAASAFVKAAVRDSKAYIKNQNYRAMYVGYATYDGPIRDQLAEYFNCGNQADAIDMWGYNVYSWCGASNYIDSGYQARTEFFQDYSVPAFFAEYGCNTEGTRTWEEVQAIYGTNMTPVWSGAIAYEYFQASNNFGLVSVINSASVSALADFTSLSAQLATISPSSTNSANYVTSTLTAFACPTQDASWSAVATPLPPAPNAGLCNCMVETLDCVVKGSVNADDYGDLFNYICAQDDEACDGIAHNGTTGDYGAYGGCTPEQQLSWVMNQYYANQGSSSSACAFSGMATLTSGASATGSCISLISAAGTNGGGSVASPTGTQTYSTGSGSSSATGTAAATSSKGAAGVGSPMMNINFGFWSIGMYILGATVTGAGMILL